MIEFHNDGTATIALHGEIDVAAVDDIADQVAAALAAAPAELVLRMQDVTFIDSTGIGSLVAARLACDALKVPFVIEHPSARASRVLELTGLAQVMTIRADGTKPTQAGNG